MTILSYILHSTYQNIQFPAHKLYEQRLCITSLNTIILAQIFLTKIKEGKRELSYRIRRKRTRRRRIIISVLGLRPHQGQEWKAATAVAMVILGQVKSKKRTERIIFLQFRDLGLSSLSGIFSPSSPLISPTTTTMDFSLRQRHSQQSLLSGPWSQNLLFQETILPVTALTLFSFIFIYHLISCGFPCQLSHLKPLSFYFTCFSKQYLK